MWHHDHSTFLARFLEAVGYKPFLHDVEEFLKHDPNPHKAARNRDRITAWYPHLKDRLDERSESVGHLAKRNR